MTKMPPTTELKQEAKRQQRKTPFIENWLRLPQFKKWLVRRIGKDQKPKPYCELCQKLLTCSKTGITRHASSKKHQSQEKLSMSTKSTCDMVGHRSNDDIASSMEVKICAFIAEHNLPLSISDSMVAFLSSMFPNDVPLKKVKLGKQKATNMLRQVLGFDYLQDMVTLLQSNMFSVIIDEATDRS